MKFIVQYTSPQGIQGTIEVDAEDDMDAADVASAKLEEDNPDVPFDDDNPWVIDSVHEAPMPRPSREKAEEVIGQFILETCGEGPGFDLAEDGDNAWAFWCTEDDTTSYLKADLSIEWYGTGWHPGYEDGEEDEEDEDDLDGNKVMEPSAQQPSM